MGVRVSIPLELLLSTAHVRCTEFVQKSDKRILPHPTNRRLPMTLCPIALVTGCAKCPAFKVCPLKEVIGDQPPAGKAGEAGKPSDNAKKH